MVSVDVKHHVYLLIKVTLFIHIIIFKRFPHLREKRASGRPLATKVTHTAVTKVVRNMTLRLPPLALAFDTGQVHLGSRVALSVTRRRSRSRARAA